jgi:DNA relaxase NicK
MLTKSISSTVDYLTITKEYSHSSDELPLYSIAKKVFGEHNSIYISRWYFYGFSGSVLRSPICNGHFAYGESATHREIIQLSGEWSKKFWLDMVNLTGNVTRIDLAVDAELYEPIEALAEQCFNEIAGHTGTRGRMVLVKGLPGYGQTLYVNSRKSDQFGRLYDKSAEANVGIPGSVWRYEVELKKRYANAMADQLADIFNQQPTRDGLTVIAQYVYHWFDKRNVPPVFDRKATGVIAVKVKSESMLTRLQWLRMQVSPTVKWLIESGQAKEAIDALGLQSFFVEKEQDLFEQGDEWEGEAES